MKTYLDIIEDTVEYYFHHNRGIDDHDCVYINDNGDRCAIGRYAKDPVKLEGIGGDIQSVYNQIIEDENEEEILYSTVLKDILIEEVSHLDNYDFWRSLQRLHDFGEYWDKKLGTGNSLNEHGQKQYIKLLETDWK